MIIYLKKFADVVIVYRERRPTREELKKDPNMRVVQEAVTVRFQKSGRPPVVDVKRTEKTR